MNYQVKWSPQPKQAELLQAAGLYGMLTRERRITPPVARLIGYGGAAFGGKTDGLLGLGIIAAFAFPGCQVGFFRRHFTELEGPDGPIDRSKNLLAGIATYKGDVKQHTFPTGSKLTFHHCATEDDRTKYQSQAWDILLIDEATHFTWQIIDYLITRNRPTIDHSKLVPFTAMATNPGNIGHEWFSQLFDVNKILGEHNQVKRILTPNGTYENVIFIPAFLEDNPIGVARDPEYATRLEARDPDIARALRWGDWSVFAGQAFPSWRRDRIAVEPFMIPPSWPRWRALDYGFVHPTSVGWFTRDINTGRVYVYRAINQSGLTDRQIARLVLDMTPPDENIAATYASPDMWARKTKDDMIFTTIDEFASEGLIVTRADNDRLGGKRKLDRLLVDLPDGKPGVQVFNDCFDVFKVMSLLIKDNKNPEDVKKIEGDDAYDMLRYGLTNISGGTLYSRNSERKRDRESPLVRIGDFI